MNIPDNTSAPPYFSDDYTLTLTATSTATANGVDTNTATATLMSGLTYVGGKSIIFIVTTGHAVFSSSGTNTVKVTSNVLGEASALLTDTTKETVTIKASLAEDANVNASTSSTFGNSNDTMPAPSVAEALSPTMTIDPADVTAGITVIIPAAAVLVAGDTVSATVNTVTDGTTTTPEHLVTSAEVGGVLSLTALPSLADDTDGSAVTVWYTVTRSGSAIANNSDSAIYTVFRATDTGGVKVMGARTTISCHRSNISTLVALNTDTLALREAIWRYDGDRKWSVTRYFRDTEPHRLLHVSAGGKSVTLNRINVGLSDLCIAACTGTGSVKAWGTAYDGGVVPPDIASLTDIVSVAVGDRGCAALRSNGSVVAWGDPYTINIVPPDIASLTDIVSVAVAEVGCTVLRSNGSVVGWGDPEPVPKDIAALTDIVSVTAGDNVFVALRSNGSVVAWGNNSNGGKVPPDIASLTDIVSFTAGTYAVAALRSNGSVVAWGDSSNGGDVPPEIARLTDIVSVAVGGAACAALRSNGRVVAWGDSSYGGAVPLEIASLTDIMSVAAGDKVFVALRSNGSVVAWGESDYGGKVPGNITSLTDIVSVSVGNRVCMALRSNGIVVAWGIEGSFIISVLDARAVYCGSDECIVLTGSGLEIRGAYEGSSDDISYEVC